MNCLDCESTMNIECIDYPPEKDSFEVVFKCPECGAAFFGTLYRDLNQATGIVDCEDCEGGKDGTTRTKGQYGKGLIWNN